MRNSINLNGTWQLYHCPDGQSSLETLNEATWLDAAVPGCAHYDLLQHGKIEDPFFEKNTRKLYDLEQHEWWYRTSFGVPADFTGDILELDFEGLDTFATVWLNGVEVGQHKNMFIPVAFDVTSVLKPGAVNELVVRLGSPFKAVEGLPLEESNRACMNDLAVLWARKLDQCYGWDIAGRIVTAGIWRPASLVAYTNARIVEDFFRVTKIGEVNADGNADAWVTEEVWVENLCGCAGALRVVVEGTCGDSVFKAEAPVIDGKATLDFTVPEAKLWWTWDLGTPNLYNLSILLYRGDQVVDKLSRKQGLRTIRLVEDPQGEGKISYVFELNGVCFFVRGMNWTPADCYHALGEGEKHTRLIEMSRRMNLNMLRVWGGGIYEPDAWFEQLDEIGIMVYQDFMMACAIYPLHPDFLEIMRQESVAIIKKLRNFSCLAIWSGDNENDCAYWGWFGDKVDVRENKITRGVLVETTSQFDGTRRYVPSSPYSPNPEINPMDQFQGDNHVWHHGTAFEDPVYTADQSRFVSEIGHLSCPSMETMRVMFGPQTIWPNDDNSYWDHHIGNHEDLNFMPPRRKALDDSVIAYFGEKPKDVETYVLASQICQGEAYKLWTEHYRQQKFGWGNAGILLWNVADSWPQISDAVIDYYLRPKLACNYTRWACEPIFVSFKPMPEDKLAIHLANDTLKPVEGTVTVKAMLQGGDVSEEVEVRIAMEANGAAEVLDITDFASRAKAAGARLHANLIVDNEVITWNRYRFDKPTLAEIPQIIAGLPGF